MAGKWEDTESGSLWKWLRGAGDWGVTAELTGELKQGEEPEQLPAAPRRPPQTSGTARALPTDLPRSSERN